MTTRTYESFLSEAETKSRSLNAYAAVVEITTYLSSSPPRMTIAVSRDKPITSRQRQGEFVGVVAQFHRGLPLYSPAMTASVAADESDDDGRLPF